MHDEIWSDIAITWFDLIGLGEHIMMCMIGNYWQHDRCTENLTGTWLESSMNLINAHCSILTLSTLHSLIHWGCSALFVAVWAGPKHSFSIKVYLRCSMVLLCFNLKFKSTNSSFYVYVQLQVVLSNAFISALVLCCMSVKFDITVGSVICLS